ADGGRAAADRQPAAVDDGESTGDAEHFAGRAVGAEAPGLAPLALIIGVGVGDRRDRVAEHLALDGAVEELLLREGRQKLPDWRFEAVHLRLLQLRGLDSRPVNRLQP